jgi:hypothetical protein
MTDKKARPGPWTDSENAAGWALYFVMQRHASTGEKYVKAHMIREANGHDINDNVINPDAPLAARGRPSVEMKLMNMSAVMESLGRPELSMSEYGYRALKGYQGDLKTMGVALLGIRDAAVAGKFNELQA